MTKRFPNNQEIRSLRCCACGQHPPSDAAHVRSRGASGSSEGWNLIPLCRRCHRDQHAFGWSKFIEMWPGVEDALRARGWSWKSIFGRFWMTNEAAESADTAAILLGEKRDDAVSPEVPGVMPRDLSSAFCGIDPGKKGAIVFSYGDSLDSFPIPLTAADDVDFRAVEELLRQRNPQHVILERAMPIAMGSKHAFNYGRHFAALEIAIHLSGVSVTYVEPTKWTKLMLDGVDARLKPKERSIVGAERLFPLLFPLLPRGKDGRPKDGPLEALLLAEYGRRLLMKGAA